MSSLMCLCLSACLSVCPSVQDIIYEPLHIETSFLVCRYIFAISRSSLSIKVIGSRSRSYEKNDNVNISFLILCISLQVINKVKITHQGEGHIKVKVKYPPHFQFYVKFYLFQHINPLFDYKSLLRSRWRSHQGQSKMSKFPQILCSPYSLQTDGLHSTEMCSCSHTALMDLRIAQNIRIEFRSYQCGGFGILH